MLDRILTLISPAAPEISGRELEQALAGSRPPLVIDIRSSEQFAAGHLPGAMHVPFDSLRDEAPRWRGAPAVLY